jgi:PhnB protein
MPHTSIAPMLSVRRGQEAVEFYKSAFGANVMYRVDSPDGAVVARLSADGAEFWVADESPEHKNFSPETLPEDGQNGDDRGRPDAAFARAMSGAAAVWPAGESIWVAPRKGRRPFGHHWEIAAGVVMLPFSGPAGRGRMFES